MEPGDQIGLGGKIVSEG
jgi:hypothetical protein